MMTIEETIRMNRLEEEVERLKIHLNALENVISKEMRKEYEEVLAENTNIFELENRKNLERNVNALKNVRKLVEFFIHVRTVAYHRNIRINNVSHAFWKKVNMAYIFDPKNYYLKELPFFDYPKNDMIRIIETDEQLRATFYTSPDSIEMDEYQKLLYQEDIEVTNQLCGKIIEECLEGLKKSENITNFITLLRDLSK